MTGHTASRSLKIAIIIATSHRGEKLERRCLQTVAAQTHAPDHLVVVDDIGLNDPANNPADVPTDDPVIVAPVSTAKTRIRYLRNERTVGASGSWNTALYALHQLVADPNELFVAVLGDDDAWAPDYLERCLLVAQEYSLDMVASDVLQIGPTAASTLSNPAHESLQAADFLAGNSAIQASNLFVRLGVLLAAGGFDEGLESGAHWDLCIRVADLGGVQYRRLSAPLVHHFINAGPTWPSTGGFAAKRRGMSGFWRKYRGRMSAAQRQQFCDHGGGLIDGRSDAGATDAEATPGAANGAFATDTAARPTGTGNPDLREQSRHPVRRLAPPATCDPFVLYVGIISAEPQKLRGLLGDLADLHTLPTITKVTVVVLENGAPRREMRRLVQELQGRGQNIRLVSEQQQRSDAADGVFGSLRSSREPGQVSIAHGRTMLQRYVGTLHRQDEAAISWILDDDMRLDERARAFLPWLPAFRQAGVDVLFGQYTGSSPNPPLNGIRVQLVDLVHNLTWLRGLDPNARLPDRSAENQAQRDLYPDYYYDLSRKHFAHLEMPHWLEAASPEETVGEAYERLCNGALGVLSGAPLTRPLLAQMPMNPLAAAKESVNRGGCTFVFNHRALTQTPNTMVQLGGKNARRSDMMWAIVNRHYHGMNIKQVGFPIVHNGRVTPTPSLHLPKVIAELVGAALYGGLTEFLRQHSRHRLNFSEEDRSVIGQFVTQHLRRRLHDLDLSFHRIRGLTSTLGRFSDVSELGEAITYLARWFTPEVFAAICAGTDSVAAHDVDSFLSSLHGICDDYAKAADKAGALRQ